MSVWAGWQADLLGNAGLPNTSNNRRFLTAWHSEAETNCENNPIDLSNQPRGASDCAPLPGLTVKAQKYPTHGDAETAFVAQLDANYAKALLSALKTGNPYTADNTGDVTTSLAAWGSVRFSRTFFADTGSAPGRGGVSTGIAAPKAHDGWRDLRHTLNHTVLSELRDSRRITSAALRSMSRKHKVSG